MATLSLKKKKIVKDSGDIKIKKPASTELLSGNKEFLIEPSDVILRPRITEKATDKQQDNVYVFEVHPNFNKKMISQAFYKIYKIKPVKVNIAKKPSKNVFVRGKKGVKKGISKAYIFLKEGDNIDIV